jgi:hypothetical protein
MSQPIYCSGPGCAEQADAIIGDMHNGDQTPLCYPHLDDWCVYYHSTVVDAEIARTDAEAEARIAAVKAPPQSAGNDGFDAMTHPEEGEAKSSEFPSTAKVVRRHTSKSRQAFEVRKAARAAAAEQVPTPESIDALGPSGSPTEDGDA